ncbi:heterokaryon incompatibility protein-domain-containing protein [Nemania abortiva]|nr:heterokaryon incompatibility protein-domain-containing protein [Nemania abortiva]
MAAYQYSPLNQDGIRLTILCTGAFHDTLYIELQEVALSLTKPPVYEALSYVWGSTKDRVPVQVSSPAGERTLMVTQNLATALRHLRFEDRLRVLWIDALCIDQSNLTERSRQVLKMGDIYRMSRRVVAWLGPESEDSSLALDTIARLAPSIEMTGTI